MLADVCLLTVNYVLLLHRNRSHGGCRNLRADRYGGQGNGWSGDHPIVHVGWRGVHVGRSMLRRIRDPHTKSGFRVRVHVRERRRVLGIRYWMEYHTRAHDW